MLSLLSLKYFCDLAETGSFTKTGKLNHVAQTSITQQIKQMEKELGTTLVNRCYKPVRLTVSGKVVYQEAKKVLNQYQVFDTNVSKYLSTQDHEIRIGYSSIDELITLENLLDKLHESNITVIKQTIKEETRSLFEGNTDLCISYDTDLIQNKKIESQPIATDELVICVNNEHPLTNKAQVEVKEVYKYPLIMLNPKIVGQSFNIMAKRTQKLGFKLNIVQEVYDIDSELFLIQHHNYLGFLPKNYPIESESSIKKIPFINSPYKYEIRIAKLKNNYDSKTIDLFQRIKSLS